MESDSYRQSLDRAADYCGIQQEFWDIFGHQHMASPETKRAVVEALGIRADNLEGDRETIEFARWSRIAEPCLVLDGSGSITVSLPESHQNRALDVLLILEDGTTWTHVVELGHFGSEGSAEFHGTRYIRKRFPSPTKLPLGYHDAHFSVSGLPKTSTRLIVTPERAFIPEFLEAGGKTGGIAIALYGLRSARNWGCGDIRDLRDFCEWAAKENTRQFRCAEPTSCDPQSSALQYESLPSEQHLLSEFHLPGCGIDR